MSKLCKYALIQFLPDIESGEFANVGILLCAPGEGLWDYRVAVSPPKRVSGFFANIDVNLYKSAMAGFHQELTITKSFAASRPPLDILRTFAEMTRERDNLVRFSNVRTLLSANPEAEIDRLFTKFVDMPDADNSATAKPGI